MADDSEYSERRRYPRHPGPFDGWLSLRKPVRVMDLNLGGCFVLVNFEHTIGESFQLRIDLGEEGLLDVTASTLYHTINGSAVAFLDLTQNAFGQIQRTVEATWAPVVD